MSQHVPMFALGTDGETQRLREVCGRLCGREIEPGEDVTAVATETLESVTYRLGMLERALKAKVTEAEAEAEA